MKLEEIESEWANDSVIDQNALGTDAANIPRMHHKYYKLLIRELMILKKKQSALEELQRDKWMYYKGVMTREECKERGWDIFSIKLITKEEIERFVAADKDVINSKLEVGLHDEKVNYLKSIIASINNRNFVIRNIIEFKKFQNGAI